MRVSSLFVVALFCSLVVGCSNGNVSVRGKITFEDGTPVTEGTVIFESNSGVGTGVISKDGSYVAGYLQDNDGLPEGTYKVAIPMSRGTASVASNQTAVATTDVTIDVKKGQKTYDLVFKAPSGGGGGVPGAPPMPPR